MSAERNFIFEGKSLTSPVVTERGDLIVTGLAADFSGIDSDQENFIAEAFSESTIRDFLTGQATLAFNHKPAEYGIGRVLDLKLTDTPRPGLEFKALVMRQEKSSPLYFIYDAIRRGVYRGVSLGGWFRRSMTEAGRRISDVRISELSLCPAAKHGGTFATAVEVKALMGDDDYLADAREFLSSRSTATGVDAGYLREARVEAVDRRIRQLKGTLRRAELIL